MARLILTSSGLHPLDGPRPRPVDRRSRHRDPARAWRYTPEYRALRKRVLAEEKVCWICGSESSPTVDHVVPVKRGGDPYDRANARRACHPCNSRKGAR